jgi:hypothetical protein
VKAPVGLNPVGRKLWREICAKMAEDDVQPDAREREILHSACLLKQRAAELEELMRNEQPCTEGSKGQTVMHPAIVEIRNTYRDVAALLYRLDLGGLDDAPTGSVGITITPAMRSVKARDAANARWKNQSG